MAIKISVADKSIEVPDNGIVKVILGRFEGPFSEILQKDQDISALHGVLSINKGEIKYTDCSLKGTVYHDKEFLNYCSMGNKLEYEGQVVFKNKYQFLIMGSHEVFISKSDPK